LRAERKRGQTRSFTYDLNRHMRLVNALKQELAFLAGLRRSRTSISADSETKNSAPKAAAIKLPLVACSRPSGRAAHPDPLRAPQS
jgi:hypothetical protein